MSNRAISPVDVAVAHHEGATFWRCLRAGMFPGSHVLIDAATLERYGPAPPDFDVLGQPPTHYVLLRETSP